MSRAESGQGLVPSVLDRLIDTEPERQSESSPSRGQLLQELKQSVARDLENLLNTRYRCVRWPPDLDDTDQNGLEFSLVNYGIPDFTGAAMGAHGNRDKMRVIVEEAVRKFEPRFKRVQVKILDNADDTDRTLRLRIDGLLYADPEPEPVVFDSQLEPGASDIQVQKPSS